MLLYQIFSWWAHTRTLDPLIKSQRLRRPLAGTIDQRAFAAEDYFSGEANDHGAALVSETSFSVMHPLRTLPGAG